MPTTRKLQRLFKQLDDWMIERMREHGIRVLRISLGLVFVWFAALKLIGETPVADLIRNVSYAIPASADFVFILGVWELLIGIGLLFAIALRTTLFLMWLQLAGTFMVFVLRPDIAFEGWNPLLLTTEGEFVVKNIVLLAAGIVIGGTVRRRQAGTGGEGRVQPE